MISAGPFPTSATGGTVLLLLVGLSCWMWCLILLKMAQFWRLRRAEMELGDCLAAWRGGGLPEGWQKRILPPDNPEPPTHLLARGEQLANQVGRHVGTILVLAQVAPLLGLIGTVIGMIATFDVIAHFGTGNLGALGQGISEALVTTQGGLLVAIPGLFLGTLLRRRSENFRDRVEAFCIAAGRELSLPRERP